MTCASIGGGDAAIIAGGLEPLFSAAIAPIVGWDVGDLDGDGRSEIVIATRYGSIVILNDRGQTIATALPGAEAFDVAILADKDGRKRILASLGPKLVLFDSKLRVLAEKAVSGAPCVKLQSFMGGGTRKAMCLFGDGTAALW